jgi:uncharacterized protein YbjQ (UPF0145 family)
MKNWFFGALALVAVSAATTAHANDRKVLLPVEAAMNANSADERLGDSVKFYFGNQKAPAALKKLGVGQTSQKTNAFGKSDATACNWAFLSAMRQLQKHAQSVGANAIINIVSNHKNVVFTSDTEFECHAGAIMAGVALKGEFVKIAE